MWSVQFTAASAKALKKLPQRVQRTAAALAAELAVCGPVLHGKGWRNFGKLRGRADQYHCHIKSGRPTYVACWGMVSRSQRVIEVSYVGTHENAPY
ncbi:MAG: hypothetical protein A2289_02715 [Deltaproteobacteria bacterium RIFOXYA12_FULL_58_15]|nr:MAG: hypothetical protein A2289_02715 [Deltaproteobacteria bacterium RIFOXYA12_FULL_58_15]OGR13452.1 MAG: hypothetical protein A2341_28005 [Deltaproteobacteria bacterium RIFOXYB12_FULL_58_9]